MLTSTAFDLVIVLAQVGQDGALTYVTVVSALAIAAKIVIASTR